MMSENSFLVNFKNNSKRRVWVWVLTLFTMLMVYPGVLTVYFARIDSYLANGYYQTNTEFREALGQAVLDFAGSYPMILSLVLAMVIALQGYSYLFSRSKIDMYHAVPVSLKRRFFTIYINGLFIYVASMLLGVIAVVCMSLAKGAVADCLYGRFFLEVLLTFLLFLGCYNMTVLAVMLTGNMFAAVMAVVIIFYVDCWKTLLDVYKNNYWSTYLTVFNENDKGISLCSIIGYPFNFINSVSYNISTCVSETLLAVLKSLIWIVAAFVLAYLNYRKRPAEAAGRPVVFYSNKIIIKLCIVIPAALYLASWMYSTSEGNNVLVWLALVLTVIIIGMLLEIAFNMEFRSAFRHWGSIFVSLVIAVFVFSVFKFDIFKYDSYIPDESDIDSYVVLNQNECYTEVINIDSTGQDYSSMYMSPAVYAKNNMKLTDAEAIVELAKKSVYTGKDNMESPLALSVYYRLKSGRNVSRTVWVDVNDESNDSYLNRIVGPAYYKEGIWQAMSMNVPEQFEVTGVTYVNSLEDKKLNITDAERIIYLWREDMSAYDYNRVRYDNEQGYITITMSNWTTWSLPVYSCFTRINNYLEKEYDYVDQKLPLEAIEKIKITKYDTDYGIYDGKTVAVDEVYDEDSGSYIYEDPEQIAQIYEALYVRPMHSDWKPYNSKEDSYSVEIDLTQEYINTYNSVSLYSYNIKGDEIDKLVEEGLLP